MTHTPNNRRKPASFSTDETLNDIAIDAAGIVRVVMTSDESFPDLNVYALSFPQSALVRAGVPFVTFTATVELTLGPRAADDTFEVKSTFTWGNGSNGIAPLTEPITMRVEIFTTTILAGAFTRDKKGWFTFAGVIDGVTLEAVIQPLGGTSFAFKAEGTSRV
jgi:hypothetical protein